MAAGDAPPSVEASPDGAEASATTPSRYASGVVPRRRARVSPVDTSTAAERMRTVHGGEPLSPSEIVPEHERPPLVRPAPRARVA